jgi:hypothetical protein
MLNFKKYNLFFFYSSTIIQFEVAVDIPSIHLMHPAKWCESPISKTPALCGAILLKRPTKQKPQQSKA